MLNPTITVRRALTTLTALAASVAVGTAGASAASADPGDPVTGGTTTISVPASSALAGARAGLVAYPIKPATATYAEDSKTVEYVLPVSGGDGSGAAAYGSIKHSGGIVVNNLARNKSATLRSFSFSLETLTLSAVPDGATAPVDVAQLTGSQTASRDAASGRQTFTGTVLALTASGAAYLDKTLSTTVFKSGQNLGSFRTEFVNTQY